MNEVLSPDVRAFLDEFDRRSSDPEADVTALFAPAFLALDPKSVVSITPQMLAKALPARRRMFADAGIRGLCRESAREEIIDPLHVLLSVEWSAQLALGAPLQLSSTFLLRRGEAGPRVVVYINHNDVQALLASRPA